MGNFFVKLFFKNPIGLIVTGILISLVVGIGVYQNQGTASWIVVGIIISAIGVLWFIKRLVRDHCNMKDQLPLYLNFVDALKQFGYVVDEFERKRDCVRSTVSLDGNAIGEIFLVISSSRYAQFRRIEDRKKMYLKREYHEELGKDPDISYWPEGYPMGAWKSIAKGNYSETEQFLATVKSIFKENLKER